MRTRSARNLHRSLDVLAVGRGRGALGDLGDEGGDDLRIELAAGHVAQLLAGGVVADRRAVGAVGGHGVVGVADRDDPGASGISSPCSPSG